MPGGIEGKQFVGSMNDARALQGAFNEAYGPGHTIVGADMPASVAAGAEQFRFSDVPGGMTGYQLGADELSRVCPVVGPGC